jgi:hypothetical protein
MWAQELAVGARAGAHFHQQWAQELADQQARGHQREQAEAAQREQDQEEQEEQVPQELLLLLPALRQRRGTAAAALRQAPESDSEIEDGEMEMLPPAVEAGRPSCQPRHSKAVAHHAPRS